MAVFGLLRRVAWEKFTDVFEVLAASIIGQSPTRLHGATTQETAIFIFAAVRT
jgi:hypothetical protein